MPPRMATEASTSVTGSPSSNVPPAAAITGTLSCNVAALVAGRPRKAAYYTA